MLLGMLPVVPTAGAGCSNACYSWAPCPAHEAEERRWLALHLTGWLLATTTADAPPSLQVSVNDIVIKAAALALAEVPAANSLWDAAQEAAVPAGSGEHKIAAVRAM